VTQYIQVLTTIDRRETAELIAREAVERRLAACVQIVGPVTSIYRWQGQVETAEEWHLWMKTRQELYCQLEQLIRQTHSYQTPEILSMPILSGLEAYLKWLDQSVGADEVPSP